MSRHNAKIKPPHRERGSHADDGLRPFKQTATEQQRQMRPMPGSNYKIRCPLNPNCPQLAEKTFSHQINFADRAALALEQRRGKPARLAQMPCFAVTQNPNVLIQELTPSPDNSIRRLIVLALCLPIKPLIRIHLRGRNGWRWGRE